MAKQVEIPKDKNIIEIPLEDAMPENYLPYAVEVAKDRALPDVRDGLKPVHRRILYGAYMLKALPDKPYYKSARIVGDILGKFHPHGDTSVYDALVILAQNFSTRYTLIDGHGNWGSIDGDSAAAMRYTEARLTPIALEMLRDIEKDVVDMVDNYSETEKEPSVLPSKYPNLLVNGTFGIAVGLSTNIPPHNLGEVIDATVAYIDNRDLTVKELMKYIKGPDLPTGGVLIGKNSINSCYETGEGKVSLRAKTSIEKLENGRWGIIIKEFPYRKNKSKILQTLSEMTADKKHAKTLESVTDIRDESDRNGIRAVIEFRKSVEKNTVEKVLKYLFKKTDLQCNLNFNMVALANGKPETMGLKTILKYYVEHQKQVITRRTKKELEITRKRFHIVEGFIKAIDIMDEIIAIIRSSKSKKDSENNLVNNFGFTFEQSQAIVELMLYKLTGLEIKVFQKEYRELQRNIKALEKILSSEKELYKVMKKELLQVKDKYNDERKTQIINDDSEAKIEIEEIIIEEDNIITISNEGFVKRISTKSYARTNLGIKDIEYREGDFNKYFIEANTKDSLVIFTNKGNMYQLKVVDLPELKWKEKGERLDSIIKGLDLENEKIVSIYSVEEFSDKKSFVFITDMGRIKKSNLNRFITNYSKLQALKVRDGESLIYTNLEDSSKELGYLKVSTKKGLEFILGEPNIEESDRNIQGVSLIYLSPRDKVKSIECLKEYQVKELYVKVDTIGNVKVSEKAAKDSVKCNWKDTILIFDNKGLVHAIPGYIFDGIKNKKLNLCEILDEFYKDSSVLNILSTENFEEEIDLYFFSKNGYVKKTALNEFKGNFISTIAYKFRNEEDVLVNIDIANGKCKKDIIMITKKAMSIRFTSDSVNYMGKIASGVIGISLKENDEVIFASLIEDEQSYECNKVTISSVNEKNKLLLATNNKNTREIEFKEIKSQNRAGRGKNIMQVSMDEFLNIIKFKN